MTERRRRGDAEDDAAVALEGEQRRPDRYAAGEVLCPVDRVDDPADTAVRVAALLFSEDVLARTLPCDPLAHHLLDRSVGVRDRAQVGLRLDVQVDRAEARHRQRVGYVCELECEREVGVDAPETTSRRP